MVGPLLCSWETQKQGNSSQYRQARPRGRYWGADRELTGRTGAALEQWGWDTRGNLQSSVWYVAEAVWAEQVVILGRGHSGESIRAV